MNNLGMCVLKCTPVKLFEISRWGFRSFGWDFGILNHIFLCILMRYYKFSGKGDVLPVLKKYWLYWFQKRFSHFFLNKLKTIGWEEKCLWPNYLLFQKKFKKINFPQILDVLFQWNGYVFHLLFFGFWFFALL